LVASSSSNLLAVLGWVGLSQIFSLVVGWVGLGQSGDGLGWIGSHKMDPWNSGFPTKIRFGNRARFTKYLTIYHKIYSRSTYDSDLQRAKIVLGNIVC